MIMEDAEGLLRYCWMMFKLAKGGDGRRRLGHSWCHFEALPALHDGVMMWKPSGNDPRQGCLIVTDHFVWVAHPRFNNY